MKHMIINNIKKINSYKEIEKKKIHKITIFNGRFNKDKNDKKCK